MSQCSQLQAVEPEISDPSFRLVPGFDAPGTFPTTVTAANVNMAPLPGVELDGAGEDFLQVSFPAAGPIPWTSSRFNGGDTALSIGPADPNNPLFFPPNDFAENFQALNTNSNPINTTSNELTTLAWRVGRTAGALLATTRHNGTENGYTIPGSAGTSTGPIHGVSYFISGFAQGWGFRMDDGVFANGGGASSDLVTGHAGAAGGRHEASFNVATALFPYAQGWQGAWVNGGVDGPASFSEGAPGLDASSVTWTGGQANVQLPGVNSATDGMLFVAPSDGSSTTRIASAFPNSSGGWTTTLRLDDDADTSGQTILTGGNGFQFFYLPYDATNLVGGMIDGTTGLPVQSAGDASFNLTRTSSGQYSLSVFESDGLTKKTEDDGMLILSVADVHPTNSTLGSRAFMSYEFDGGSGDFVIEARELISTNGANPSDNFGNEFAMNDVDFYFAWVDFANPLSPPTAENADFNGDGAVDGHDFLTWQQGAILSDGSGSLAAGDANGDGNINASDFAIWEGQFGTTAAMPSVGAVPEATAAVLALLGSIAGLAVRRRS